VRRRTDAGTVPGRAGHRATGASRDKHPFHPDGGADRPVRERKGPVTGTEAALPSIPSRALDRTPPETWALDVEIARAGLAECRRLELPVGSRVADAVRAVGLSPEGTAALLDDRPVPMDEPLAGVRHLLVVPTFSGG